VYPAKKLRFCKVLPEILEITHVSTVKHFESASKLRFMHNNVKSASTLLNMPWTTSDPQQKIADLQVKHSKTAKQSINFMYFLTGAFYPMGMERKREESRWCKCYSKLTNSKDLTSNHWIHSKQVTGHQESFFLHFRVVNTRSDNIKMTLQKDLGGCEVNHKLNQRFDVKAEEQEVEGLENHQSTSLWFFHILYMRIDPYKENIH